MAVYKHVISLGWFCSVAEEIERLGLRNASYPFDWILTDWDTVKDMLNGSFTDFLAPDKLFQDAKTANMYHHRDRQCLTYVHDIDPYENYRQQVKKAQDKYERRLERLKHDICEPSIFLRYIRDKKEFQYVVENRESIEEWLKSFHPDNQIAYISNQENGQAPFIWSVQKDENDGVARTFLTQLPELKEWLMSQEYSFSVEKNLKRYRNKSAKKKVHRYLLKARHGVRRLEKSLAGKEKERGRAK